MQIHYYHPPYQEPDGPGTGCDELRAEFRLGNSVNSWRGTLRTLLGILQPAYPCRHWPKPKHFRCPHCKKPIEANEKYWFPVGTELTCPHCNKKFRQTQETLRVVRAYMVPDWKLPPKGWFQKFCEFFWLTTKQDEPWNIPPIAHNYAFRPSPQFKQEQARKAAEEAARKANPPAATPQPVNEDPEYWATFHLLGPLYVDKGMEQYLVWILNADALQIQQEQERLKLSAQLYPEQRHTEEHKTALLALQARFHELERQGRWISYRGNVGVTNCPSALDIAEGVWLGNQGPGGWWLLARMFGR